MPTFGTPTAYYFWLRRYGYRPRTAALAALAVFCKTADDKARRIARWGRRGGRNV